MEQIVADVVAATQNYLKTDFVQNVNKMLNVRINTCSNCQNLFELLCEIDEKLKYYLFNQHKNDSLLLDLNVKKDVIKKLIRYKRITIKRLYNPSYGCDITLGEIITQIKIYINK